MPTVQDPLPTLQQNDHKGRQVVMVGVEGLEPSTKGL